RARRERRRRRAHHRAFGSPPDRRRTAPGRPVMLRVSRGALVEYAVSLPPLVLMFEFNPEQISRSRTITVRTGNAPGTRGGYDFVLPTETPRVAQGVTVQPETLTIDVLFDAT